MSDSSEPIGQQLVEIVDDDGRVIEVTTRVEMRRQSRRHRCTYVAVIACDGLDDGRCRPETELIVHQRADWKDVCPSYWDIAFGGVCGVGESWIDSAHRELEEEAGLFEVELVDLGRVDFVNDETAILGRAYVAPWRGSVVNNDGEVAQFGRVPLKDVNEWVSERDVCPDSAQVLLPLLERLWMS